MIVSTEQGSIEKYWIQRSRLSTKNHRAHATFSNPPSLSTGKQQIIGAIFLTEIITEAQKPHYTKGGDLPGMVFPPIDFSKVDAETMKRKRSSELNNGRLAMIAIMSFVAAANVPGSVPALANSPMF